MKYTIPLAALILAVTLGCHKNMSLVGSWQEQTDSEPGVMTFNSDKTWSGSSGGKELVTGTYTVDGLHITLRIEKMLGKPVTEVAKSPGPSGDQAKRMEAPLKATMTDDGDSFTVEKSPLQSKPATFNRK